MKNVLTCFVQLLLLTAVPLLTCVPLRAAAYGAAAHGAVAAGGAPMVNLALSDGLAGETVHALMTDHGGTLWVATNSGISVYNGRQVHTMRLLDADGGAMAVYDLCETRSRVVYAATEQGLYRLPYGATQFERVLQGQVDAVGSLLAVGDTVYIGSEQGVQWYDGRRLQRRDLSPSRKGLDNIVRQYVVDDAGRLWFLGRHDLNRLDPASGHIERYPLGKQLLPTQLASVGRGRFAIGTRGNGLLLYDTRQRRLQAVDGVGKLVVSVQRAADGSICVATDGSGAYRMEVKDERGKMKGESLRVEDGRTEDGKTGDGRLAIVEHFSTAGDQRHRLPTNGVYCYRRDANGVNWFGMVRHGMAYSYHSGTVFLPATMGDFTTEGLNVRTYCRHADDAIVGTQDGFYHVNAATGHYRYYSPADLGGGHIVNTVSHWGGHFYIGTFDGGLRRFDPASGRLERLPQLPQLDNCSIGDVKAGPDGRLWIGCSHGLYILAADGSVDQHLTEQNSPIVGGLVLSITFDRQGNAWLTGATGCSLYSVRSHGIVEAAFPDGFFDRQPWMRGAPGHDGLVFMRTGPKTYYTNEPMTQYGELALPVRFYDKWCRNMVDDRRGHYWLSSERGVFRFDYQLSRVQRFGYGEGLRGNMVNDMGQTADGGRLWVATNEGLYFTDAHRLTDWQQDDHYRVYLFNIRRGSDLVANHDGYEVNEEHRLHIGWNLTSEVLQAEPMLMDYADQRGRLYEYRVDGGAWTLVDDGRSIDVRRLLMGSHRLEVRLAGAEGTTSVYRLTVMPTAGALAEGALVVVLAVLLWLWWRYRKSTRVLLSERDEIEDALVELQDAIDHLPAPEEAEDSHGQSSMGNSQSAKYQKVKVDEQECAAIVARMKEYLDRERVYTDQDLKMKDLAAVLHLSSPKLSQVFNLYLREPYYDFINRYRLEEFKRLIAEGAHRRYTITALSEQAGFKKSNFFTTFRKVEGMTPMEYLKKQGVKV